MIKNKYLIIIIQWDITEQFENTNHLNLKQL